VAALLLLDWGLVGMSAAFALGLAILVAGMLGLIIREFPAEHFISFEYFRRDLHVKSQVWTGLAYN
jgi:uncharacterized membrane protein